MVLLTGGAGFIGSHTAVELIESGYEVVIVDDLSNCDMEVLDNIEKITGKKPVFYKADVKDKDALRIIFKEHKIDSVVHFAGFKAVGESVEKPVMYYRNNIDTTLSLLETMKEFNVKKFIFSSSATIYGDAVPPCVESMETGGCTNPYGWTKWMNEQILKDASKADPELRVVLLRYFNPVGAHESGFLGEKPNGIPNNLMPYISQVASGKLEKLNVFGDDYDTLDGTGVRDYIHVVDLAKGHVAALRYLDKFKGCDAINLGTGVGYSVLDMIKAFSKVNNIEIPYVIAERRSGDIAALYSTPEKAYRVLGWKAEKTLEDMCRDTWNWEKNCKATKQIEGTKHEKE